MEEPPGYCTIILICTRPEMLLATTKSRCQTIRFGLIDEDKIIKKLQQAGLDNNVAEYFARLAQGSLGAASQWAQLELQGGDFYRISQDIVDCLANYEYAHSLNLAQQFLAFSKQLADVWSKIETEVSKKDINRRAAKTVIRVVISALHDAMKLNILPEKQIMNFDHTPQIRKLAERLGYEEAAKKIADCYETLQWIDSSVNETLIFEQLLLNIADSGKIKV